MVSAALTDATAGKQKGPPNVGDPLPGQQLYALAQLYSTVTTTVLL